MKSLGLLPESIFIDIVSKILHAIKNKFAKKQKVKVRSKNSNKK